MASGWANDDAVNEQINNTIEDAVARARGELPTGKVCMNAKNVVINPSGQTGGRARRTLVHHMPAG